jgi:hypothetical protein
MIVKKTSANNNKSIIILTVHESIKKQHFDPESEQSTHFRIQGDIKKRLQA